MYVCIDIYIFIKRYIKNTLCTKKCIKKYIKTNNLFESTNTSFQKLSPYKLNFQFQYHVMHVK